MKEFYEHEALKKNNKKRIQSLKTFSKVINPLVCIGFVFAFWAARSSLATRERVGGRGEARNEGRGSRPDHSGGEVRHYFLAVQDSSIGDLVSP